MCGGGGLFTLATSTFNVHENRYLIFPGNQYQNSRAINPLPLWQRKKKIKQKKKSAAETLHGKSTNNPQKKNKQYKKKNPGQKKKKILLVLIALRGVGHERKEKKTKICRKDKARIPEIRHFNSPRSMASGLGGRPEVSAMISPISTAKIFQWNEWDRVAPVHRGLKSTDPRRQLYAPLPGNIKIGNSAKYFHEQLSPGTWEECLFFFFITISE